MPQSSYNLFLSGTRFTFAEFKSFPLAGDVSANNKSGQMVGQVLFKLHSVLILNVVMLSIPFPVEIELFLVQNFQEY